MAKQFKLAAERRQEIGSAACRRLRSQGLIPGNVYGHGAETQPISIPVDLLRPVVKSGAHVVDIDVDGNVEKTILREVQWDTFGINIYHVDLMRVDPNERVTLDVSIELRGTAVGVQSGGMLEQPLHSISIECSALQIPDSIQVKVGHLDIGQTIHVSDLQLPEGATCSLPPDTVVVHVIKLAAHEEEVAVEGPSEPEVVGRKVEEEEDDK